MVTEMAVAVNFFNSKRTAWEPLLENWAIALEVGIDRANNAHIFGGLPNTLPRFHYAVAALTR